MSEPVKAITGHKWGATSDNERVICIYCECSPLSWQAKEVCHVAQWKVVNE